MRSVISIFVGVLYLAFSVGLTVHVHQCDSAHAGSDLSFASSVSIEEESCHAEEVHPCCEDKEQESCCSSVSSQKDECCVDAHVLIQIDDEQLLSKSGLTFYLSEVINEPSIDLAKIYTDDSIQENRISHPPPIKEEKHIRFCSLTYYG